MPTTGILRRPDSRRQQVISRSRGRRYSPRPTGSSTLDSGSGNRLARARYPAAAKHRVAVVENCSLTSSYPARRLMQIDPYLVADMLAHGGVHLAVRSQLHVTIDWLVRREAAGPYRLARFYLHHIERFGRADGDGARNRLNVQHKPGLAVGCRPADTQALALPDCESVAAVMAANNCAVGVNDLTRCTAKLAVQEITRVAVRDEAHVVAVRLVGHGKTAISRFLPDLILGDAAQREHGASKLITAKNCQHVRLILADINASNEPVASVHAGDGLQAGVVTCANCIKAKGDCPVQDSSELDLLVAAQARVRRVAAGVLSNEVLDHISVEPLSHIPDVERDADDIGGSPGVARVLERATTARSCSIRARIARQRQMHASYVVSCFSRPGSGHSRVHAARHGGQHMQGSHPAQDRSARDKRLPSSPAGPLHDFADDRAELVDIRLLRRVPQREPKRAASSRHVGAHG